MNARQAYKANHSDLRAFGRFAKSQKERLERIAQACRDRAFWLKDPRCNSSGIAALRVLNGSLGMDCLDLRADLHKAYSELGRRAPYIPLHHVR